MANEIMDRHNDTLRDWFGNSLMNNFPTFFNDSDIDTVLKTDIKESDKDYEVKVDMPDFDKKNIDINYQNDTLTISGHRDSFNDHEDKNGDMIMSERSNGRFARQYHLPAVDEQSIKADYTDGVLKITLPKVENKKELGHHINIG
ncbi:Hsp20/alpha crystallin family protein [Companilactobacillus allii]|uniref:Heat-shock protein Hsp20 n=1 Tax=Companilactobacillus allii TaxID=1847728 RepID=A0A1P8Q0H0_9LACO|nr:Hsp20/alpha crystallin family protein [Companilactobacillus allii]APX71370.1 heat-shock protein Hsp20 [Companilactobacillus allii]USQ68451.1 Hsp20/alpha crystallin family protein [Companilactobacillus allii]